MRLALLLKPEHSWFIDLLDRYHLEVYCISLKHREWMPFFRASLGNESIGVWNTPLNRQVLDERLVLDRVNDPGIQLIMQCTVTQKMLGLLCSIQSTRLLVGKVDILASMRGVLNELYGKKVDSHDGEMGTKIGSLLLTSYSLFLLSQTQITSFSLRALSQSKNFYERVIKMRPYSEGKEFITDTLPCPGREYYEELLTPKAILGKDEEILFDSHQIQKWTPWALKAQRLFRSKKVMQLCSTLSELIADLKVMQSSEPIDLRSIALTKLIYCLQYPSFIVSKQPFENYPHKNGDIKTEMEKILEMPFMEPYKNIGLVQFIMNTLRINKKKL